MPDEATLSHDGNFTIFKYGGHTIRFRTSSRLERYIRVLEWDQGYMVVIAKYQGLGEKEDYIDLVPILENLYYEWEEFLKPIRKVRIV